jgi:hypothetical protein
MDDLGFPSSLAGVVALTTGYAHAPLRVRTDDGSGHLAVVRDEAITGFGFAASYERVRLYLNFDAPLLVTGHSGTAAGWTFAAPDVGLGKHPDTLSDVRVGVDRRIVGGPGDAVRVGASAQLFVPNGMRADYVTDDTYRFMGRVLVAGEIGPATYAGHVGVHVRPHETASPDGPRGSELLFGFAAGPRFAPQGWPAIIVGPELFGETAFRGFVTSDATGLEALLTGRLEGAISPEVAWHLRAGFGAGLNPSFGAPAWRSIVSLEVSGRQP